MCVAEKVNNDESDLRESNKKKINTLFTSLRSTRIAITCELGLQDLDRSQFPSLYGPPGRQITYMFSAKDVRI